MEDWSGRESALPWPDPFLGDNVPENDTNELQGVNVECIWMFRGQGDALPKPLGEGKDAEKPQLREGDGDSLLGRICRSVRRRMAWNDVTNRLVP